jgi:hypothetical protein
MSKARKPRRLADTYTFPGFHPLAYVQRIFGDPQARLITLVRRRKKHSAARVEQLTGPGTTVVYTSGINCPRMTREAICHKIRIRGLDRVSRSSTVPHACETSGFWLVPRHGEFGLGSLPPGYDELSASALLPYTRLPTANAPQTARADAHAGLPSDGVFLTS